MARHLFSPDLIAFGTVTDVIGGPEDASSFDRRGRATVSFARRSVRDPWVATHTHMSLFRGTPDPSHGSKPARG